METSKKIIWIVDGKIKEFDKFKNLVNTVIDMAHKEPSTKTYWWSTNDNNTIFSDLDTYDNTPAALKHIEHWSKHNDEFELCAKINRLIVLGNVEQQVKDAMSAMNPHYMNFYGGFVKDKPSGTDQESDIIWSFEGRVTNKEVFREAMERLVPITQEENGAMLYWWCTDEEDRFFVLEKYLNNEAAITHMSNSAEFGKLFFSATEITQFNIYSDINPELATIVADLHPLHMSKLAGFSR